ncbi:MAG: NIF family HAD-type phosphatase [Chitinophagales bacterium]
MPQNEKILLILDLDETLIFATEKPLEREADFNVLHYHVYKRPFLKAFLEEVQHAFQIAVWSSASDDYVEEVVKHIFPKTIHWNLFGGEVGVFIEGIGISK